MQNQLVCNGCRNLLLYARGATNVCCAVCSTVTPVTSSVDMAQLVCGGCRTLLMYSRGATSVRCSCCNSINAVRSGTANPVAHVNCAQCRITLMYPYGAPSVKCAICHYVTNVRMRLPPPHVLQTTSTPAPQPQNVTVVVENPMSLNASGKLVSNVVVGVTTGKK